MRTRQSRVIATIAGGVLLAGASLVQAGIVNSKHDLSSANINSVNKVTGTEAAGTGTTDTCVFCHTPHKAASNTVPLWNKQLTTAPTGANVYSSTTMDGTANFTGSTSMACLSCHDGTQAMDNIINAAGSDNYDATGGGTNGRGYTWTGATVDINGLLTAGAVTNLSANLGDDHPVAIPYGGGGVTVTATTGPTSDPDFIQVNGATGNLKTASIGGVQKWWFDTANAGKMDANEIRLYTANNQPQVECASCHDPHNPANGTFLRIANTSSAVCTTCHVK